MRIKQTNIVQYVQDQNIATEDTTADGKQAFLIIGDSTAKGSNDDTGPGPTPTPGTAYYYRRSNDTVIEIEDNDLEFAADPPTNGSPWPKFAIDYNANSGMKAVIIATARGGADYADNGDGNNWSTTGANYALALADASACLSVLGLTKLKAIFINMGPNDAASAVALGTVQTAINSLYSRLQSDFPNVDIVVTQPGRILAAVINSRLGPIRGYVKDVAINNDRVFLLGGFLSAYSAGDMTVGLVHLNQTGQNHVGAMFARWMKNSSYPKWARSIISSYYSDLSVTRKNLIASIDDHLASYLNHETLFMFKATVENDDAFHDWALLTCCDNVTGAAIVTPGSHIQTNGSSTYLDVGFAPDYSDYKQTQDDCFLAVKIKTHSTPAGTGCTILGLSSAGSTHGQQLTQTATSVLQYRVNDSTATQDGTDTNFQNNTEYMAARNGGTKYLFKNGVEIDSAGVASTDQSTFNQTLGANNNAGTVGGFANTSFEYLRNGKHVGTDHASFVVFLENVLNHWND